MVPFTAIVLAAGQGTRMKSATPKVLHSLAGRPLVAYPLRAAFDAGAAHAVLVTSGDPTIAAAVVSEFPSGTITVVTQDPPRGTGDAARIAFEALPPDTERVLILYGDTPLIRARDLSELVAALDRGERPDLSVMTCRVPEPAGYGRALRDSEDRKSVV